MGIENRDSYELFWAHHQPFLLERGYLLRPRYGPNWTPPWRLPDAHSRDPWDYEEAYIPAKHTKVMDATRISDGSPVVFKRTSYNSPEIQMLKFLCDARFASGDNGTIPLLEVITVPSEAGNDPSEALIVMPKFMDFHRLEFHCRSEVAHFMRSVLEAVVFMHSRNLTHGFVATDLGTYNILMDPTDVCPEGYHFASLRGPDGLQPLRHRPRCEVPYVEYYLIDFEGSLWFPAGRAIAALEPDNVKSQWKWAIRIYRYRGRGTTVL